MTLIIGSEGSMGRRYQAILNHIGQPFERYDLKLGGDTSDISKYDKFILATPTDTHAGWIGILDQYCKPILCEKPLSKNLTEVERILNCRSPLTMMMQYDHLNPRFREGPSRYDYYHHGSDGLVWDCFQIVALARGMIDIKETSPIWRCALNGMTLIRGDMDQAYINAVLDFYHGKFIARETLEKYHKKVSEYAEQLQNN